MEISSSGHGVVKDFLIIFLGALVGAFIVWGWDITVGKALANATSRYGGVSVNPGA